MKTVKGTERRSRPPSVPIWGDPAWFAAWPVVARDHQPEESAFISSFLRPGTCSSSSTVLRKRSIAACLNHG